MSNNTYFKPLPKAGLKGTDSTILVIGGSSLYTGAPYFSALSALKCGADLVYISSEKAAITPLKILLPEAIVFELCVSEWIFNKCDVCIFGPGLGRANEESQSKLVQMVEKLIMLGKPMIIDGDGISFYIKHVDKFKNAKLIVITPNANEYKRLNECGLLTHDNLIAMNNVKNLRKQLNESSSHIDTSSDKSKISNNADLEEHDDDKNYGVYVVRKGENDEITNGTESVVVSEENAYKRCGGQGDVLNGILAMLIAQDSTTDLIKRLEVGCKLLRKASKLAFVEKRRSLMTRDIIDKLESVVNEDDKAK